MKTKLRIGDIIYNSDGEPTHIVGTNKKGELVLLRYNPMNYGGSFEPNINNFLKKNSWK